MTWSIVAADSATGEVGVAVASCVALDVVQQVPGFGSNGGALVTQSYLFPGERERGIGLLENGLPADVVLSNLLDPTYDPDFEQRQIAIIDGRGRIASFTGAEALVFAGDDSRTVGTLSVAVQGNVLTGREVVDEALAAALEPSACDVPARLIAALEAGGRDGRGDARCTPLGVSAQSATLRSGAFAIDAGVAEPGEGDDPLVTLRTRFDARRLDRPCPAANGSGGADAGPSTAATTGNDEPSHVGADATDGDGCSLAEGRGATLSPLLGGLLGAALVAACLSRRRQRPPHRPSRSVRSRSRR